MAAWTTPLYLIGAILFKMNNTQHRAEPLAYIIYEDIPKQGDDMQFAPLRLDLSKPCTVGL